MSLSTARVIKEALQKTENERAEIALTLISSLEREEVVLDQEWKEEILRRTREIESGNAVTYSPAQVRSRVEKAIEKARGLS